MTETNQTPAIKVSQYINFLNQHLKNYTRKVVGEVTDLKISSKGHVYFSLKDPEDESVLDCVIFKWQYRINEIELDNGMEIIVSGTPNIYAPWGKLSFKVSSIELKGEGALKKAYDQLKHKLEKEGIFAEENKRKLPKFPKKIGIITSLKGAVIHDFANNLGAYGFKIKTLNTQVEGKEAIEDILKSIQVFKEQDIDLLIIMRGGGSLQSLAAFDNETLVREVINFKTPVIAGIGHHQDVPLTALAADKAVSTPTAVANLLNQPWENLWFKLENLEKHILEEYQTLLLNARYKLREYSFSINHGIKHIGKYWSNLKDRLTKHIWSFSQHITRNREDMARYQTNIFQSLEQSIHYKHKMLANLEKIISLHNPQNQLKLGYSILRKNGKIIKTGQDIQTGEELDIELSDSYLTSKIKTKRKKDKKE